LYFIDKYVTNVHKQHKGRVSEKHEELSVTYLDTAVCTCVSS